MSPPDSARAEEAGGRQRAQGFSGAVERLPRVGYLGPEGTFTEEALLASAEPGGVRPVALPTIYDTVVALARGELEWAVVPIENSLDGSVSVTLDLLATEDVSLEIVGEALLSVRHSLIACEDVALGEIRTVLTHPQVPGQCERFLRGELAHARVLAASSTAEAVRIVAADARREQAALGTRLAAEIYGATVIREDVQDRDDNETRFVWLARSVRDPRAAQAGGDPPLRNRGEGEWKTSLVFWGPGADSAGWLVRCLDEFGRRRINLTKIESRPKRERMGSYMFFVDLQGRVGEPAVRQALNGLREICERVRVLGSYRAGRVPAGLPPSVDTAAAGVAGDLPDSSKPSLHSGATDG
jgi:prephenate dehydratase